MAPFQGNLELPLVPRKRKEMTFVYADTIPIRKFTEKEESQGARRMGVSVLRERRRNTTSHTYDCWDRRAVSERSCCAPSRCRPSSKPHPGGPQAGPVTFAALVDRYVEEE